MLNVQSMRELHKGGDRMMFNIASEEAYYDGQIIFKEGNSGDWIYVVESGAVELSKKVNGKKVVIKILRPVEVFGELGYFGNIARTTTARAIGPTVIGSIDRDFLDSEFNKLSGGFRVLLRTLALRLKTTTDTAVKSVFRRNEPRVFKDLPLEYCSKNGSVKAWSDNISSNGIFIKTPKPLLKGESLRIFLQLQDDSKPIQIEGKVSWVRLKTDDHEQAPVGMGIKFSRISMIDRVRLEDEIAIAEASKSLF